MNVSGPTLLQAWKTWLEAIGREPGGTEARKKARLVVLHDEKEKSLGMLRILRGVEGSPRGHNGIKSVVASVKKGGNLGGSNPAGTEWLVRVGVGIGMPPNKHGNEMVEWVLGRMTAMERKSVEEARWKVMELIEELRRED